jgi:hypothetical protein
MAAGRMKKSYIIECRSGDGDRLTTKLSFAAWRGETAMNFRGRHTGIANAVFQALLSHYGALNTEFTKK